MASINEYSRRSFINSIVCGALALACEPAKLITTDLAKKKATLAEIVAATRQAFMKARYTQLWTDVQSYPAARRMLDSLPPIGSTTAPMGDVRI